MNPKALTAEFLGTFTLTFIGAGAGALAGASGAGQVGVALGHGVALRGKIGWASAVGYWIAQFAGAIVAAYILAWLIGKETGLGATTGSLTAGDPMKVILVEGLLTFLLVSAVYRSGIDNKNGNMVGVAIGFVLTADILMGGPLTGASMNPARTLGPAIATGNTSYVWMYFVGQFGGAVLAWIAYNITTAEA
jgi:aquaporin Z